MSTSNTIPDSFTKLLTALHGPAFTGAKLENWTGTVSGFGAKAINFGRPSSSRATRPAASTSGGSGSWQNLLTQAATQGAASLLTGQYGSASLGGFGLSPIVSGLLSLFGGHAKQPTPLQLFSLPASVNQTVHLQGGGGGSVMQLPAPLPNSQWIMDRSNEIASAVKTAMLNSHSLNDVVMGL